MKITFIQSFFAQVAGNVVTRLFFLWGVLCFSFTVKAQTGPLYYAANENLAQKTEKFLFIKVETDKKEALEGEAILAKYRLYVAVDIEGKLSKSPSFSGFASYDMESGNADAYEVEKIGGIPFRVYLIKQVQLFGLQPGLQRLQPVELEATIRYRKNAGGMNEQAAESVPADTLYHYTVKSPPVDIVIKPLPGEKPKQFSGAVGNFEYSAFASSLSIPAGRADTLHLVLKGKGNWHEITLPPIKWPADAEIFEPFESENINPLAIPLEGLRTISYPVVFNKKGNHFIPPVDFTYFNPESGRYTTIRSDSIAISVTDAVRDNLPGNIKTGNKLTSIFTGYAVVIFPAAAFILAGLLFFRRRNN